MTSHYLDHHRLRFHQWDQRGRVPSEPKPTLVVAATPHNYINDIHSSWTKCIMTLSFHFIMWRCKRVSVPWWHHQNTSFPQWCTAKEVVTHDDAPLVELDTKCLLAKKQLRKQNYLPKTNFISCICRADHNMNTFKHTTAVFNSLEQSTTNCKGTHNKLKDTALQYWPIAIQLQPHVLLHLQHRDIPTRRPRSSSQRAKYCATSSKMASQSLNIINKHPCSCKEIDATQPE